MISFGLIYYVEFPAHTNVKDTENSTVVLYCTEKGYMCVPSLKKTATPQLYEIYEIDVADLMSTINLQSPVFEASSLVF